MRLGGGWSYLRKFWYRRTEKEIEERLLGDLRKKFFLAPLQVYNDAQIVVHSNYDFVTDFINHVLHSFSRAQALERTNGVPEGGKSIADDVVVFKHHPMDRGAPELRQYHQPVGKAPWFAGARSYISMTSICHRCSRAPRGWCWSIYDRSFRVGPWCPCQGLRQCLV